MRKRIDKITLNKKLIDPCDILKKREMINLLGGSGDGECCYSWHWSVQQTESCPNAQTCDDWAGPDGWWCCSPTHSCNCSS